MAKRQPKPKPSVGWREWVALPDLSPIPIKAKVDTGARTSSLHAFKLALRTVEGQTWADFEVHPIQRSRIHPSHVSVPVVGFRNVRSSSGHAERRPVILTRAHIGSNAFDIKVTLTSRDEMGFRMLLGRGAIRKRYVVDVSKSYLHPPQIPDGEPRDRSPE